MDIKKMAKETSFDQLLTEWNNLNEQSKNELISYAKTGSNVNLKSFIRQVVVLFSTIDQLE